MTTPIDAAGIVAAICKPLEWQEPCAQNNYTHIAPSIFGDYYVHVDGGRHQAWLEAHVKPYENIIGAEVGGLLQAQFAAEADYRARIAASLDLGKVVALVEAGRKLISLVDRTQEDLDRGGSPLENLYERVEDAEDEIRATLAAFKGIQP
jgi:hypothetical protein